MADRKALLHYYPPDFDPSKIPRRKLGKDRQQVVRLMAPFSMRCNTCGEYVYKGKKFNARKETVQNEDYYGIKIFRFYIKCTRCSAEITFKTDPKNTDYVAEHGASRNFEPWREEKDGEKMDKLATLEEEENDPMKALENRTLDSRREMEILDALQDIRTRNARLERVDADAVLESLVNKGKTRADPEELERRKAEEEDEALVRKYFSRAQDIELDDEKEEAERQVALEDANIASASGSGASQGSPATPNDATPNTKGRIVKRQLEDDESEPAITSLLSEKARAQLNASSSAKPLLPPTKKRNAPNAFGLIKKK